MWIHDGTVGWSVPFQPILNVIRKIYMYYYCMRPLHFVSVRCVSFSLIFYTIRRICSVWSNTKFQSRLTLFLSLSHTLIARTVSLPLLRIFNRKSEYSIWDSMYLLLLLCCCFDVTLSAFLQQENFINLNELSKYNIWDGNSPREMIHFIRKYFMTRFWS